MPLVTGYAGDRRDQSAYAVMPFINPSSSSSPLTIPGLVLFLGRRLTSPASRARAIPQDRTARIGPTVGH